MNVYAFTPPASDPRVLGGKYYSAYWQMNYEVTYMEPLTGALELLWANGTRSTSLTAWDQVNDRVVCS